MNTEQNKTPPQTPEQPEAPSRKRRPFRRQGNAELRSAIMLLVVCVAASALAIIGTDILASRRRASSEQAQALRDQATARLAEAQTQKQELLEYQPKFSRLQKDGFVGDENRLGLLERFRDIQREHRLFAIKYELSPQRPVALAQAASTANLELRESRLAIRMELLHEMDLFTLLAGLDTGVYVPRACTLRRMQAAASGALSPRLSAECTLHWITFGDRTAPSGVPQAPQENRS